jgi:hypothetical protein
MTIGPDDFQEMQRKHQRLPPRVFRILVQVLSVTDRGRAIQNVPVVLKLSDVVLKNRFRELFLTVFLGSLLFDGMSKLSV